MEIKNQITKLVEAQILKFMGNEEFVDKLALALSNKLLPRLRPEIIKMFKDVVETSLK